MPLSFTVNQSQEETRKEVCMCTEMTTTNVVIFQELTENIKEIERLICNKSREKNRGITMLDELETSGFPRGTDVKTNISGIRRGTYVKHF